MSQNNATLQDSHASQQRNVCCALITWVIALCIWLKKKLHPLNGVNFLQLIKVESYRNERKLFTLNKYISHFNIYYLLFILLSNIIYEFVYIR